MARYMKKLFGKYRQIPVQARASFWFLICGVLQNGLNIITLPIFTRVLSTEQYGLSSTYFAWNDLIIVICTLRLSYGVFDKGMLQYAEKRDRFVSSLLGLTTTISVLMMSIFLLFHSVVEEVLGMSFVLCFSLFAVQIFAPALLFWTARNRYEYKYQKFTIVTLGTSVCCTLLNLLAVLRIPFDRGVVKILSYQFIWCVVYVVFYVYIFCKGRVFYDKDIWKFALRFNLPLIPYFLSTLILDKADRLMIGYFCGQADVALYSVSYNLGRLMVLLTSAIDATFTPWIYQKMKTSNLENCKKISGSIMVLFLGMAVVFMIFAPELLTIFAAEQYKQAIFIIPPVVASYFFIMLYGLVSKVEFYFERTKSIALITVLAAVLDIVLNYLAIPRWGYVAAGYTTLISYIVMTIGHFALAGRIARKNRIYDKIFPWKMFIAISFAMLLITTAVNVIYPYHFVRWTMVIVIFTLMIAQRRRIIRIVKMIRGRGD